MRTRDDLVLAFGSVKGPIRSENQDDFLVWEPEDDAEFVRHGRLLAVADGMGGGPAGAEASRVALRAFLGAYIDAGATRLEVAPRLERAFAAACDRVAAEAKDNPALDGMGTTLTAVVIRDSEVRGLHVGDSRCLVVQEGASRWLTTLHISGAGDPRLTRAVVAGQPRTTPETFDARLRPGDRVLLMTDGLWRAVPEPTCFATIDALPPAEAVARLLELAQEEDGSDNATVVLAACVRPRPAGRVEAGEIDAEARPRIPVVRGRGRRFARLWPWLLLGLGAALGAVALVTR